MTPPLSRLRPSLRVLLAAADRSVREHLRALFRDDDRFVVVDAGEAVGQAIQSQPNVLVLDVSGRATRAASNDPAEAGANPAHAVDFDRLLTPREAQIVSAVVAACSNKDIAAQFAITETTVKHHLSNIFDKLGVSSRLELAMFAQHHGLGQNDGRSERRSRREARGSSGRRHLRAAS